MIRWASGETWEVLHQLARQVRHIGALAMTMRTSELGSAAVWSSSG